MDKKIKTALLSGLLALALLAGCASSTLTQTNVQEQPATISTTVSEVANATTSTQDQIATNTPEVSGSTQTSVDASTQQNANTSNNDVSIDSAPDHDDAEDYQWDSASLVEIRLDGTAISADSAAVRIDGSKATITAAGSYSLSGNLTDGQINVDTSDEGIVRLILIGVDIKNSTSAAINVINADEAQIVLADNSVNMIEDGSDYVFASAEEDEPNAAIFSKDNLTISGNGALTVNAHYNDAIASKDGLVITGGTISVDAADDGIRGKNYLVIKAGTLVVTAQGDGLKSDEIEDATQGYIAVENGTITVTAGGDAMDAETDVVIAGGAFRLSSGGGSQASIDAESSAKAIKGTVAVQIDGGTFTTNAADDVLHSNGSLLINNGSFVIATGDDALHADASVQINGGSVRIDESYEGIESAVITLNGGDIQLRASDDGVNIAGGNDSGITGGRPPRPGQASTTPYTGSNYLYINGGTLFVDADGDGIDVNGAVKMTDGLVVVCGPTQQMNGALDYDASFTITGGMIVAAGSAGMAQTPDASSSQNSLLLNLDTAQTAGTLIHIQSSDGKQVLTFAPNKAYQSVALSSPELVNGTSYTVYLGGSAAGAQSGGLYDADSYTPGDEYTSFTVSSVVTSVGSAGRFR